MAFATVVVWAIAGPIFKFSENWQLVINTGTTIITFLMVFLDYTARRRVASFGGHFDYDALTLREGPPLPLAFTPLRDKVAASLGVPTALFSQLLVAEYRPGTPLGWHRDVPDFESIVGISLTGHATMKFRRYPHVTRDRSRALQLELPTRSLYVIDGDARWRWQHSVAPTRELRYSITLRTRRGSAPLLGREAGSAHRG